MSGGRSGFGCEAEVEAAVARRYQIQRRLGKGAYGVVWKAAERASGASVAVKKIFDAFRNRTDAQRTFREVAFLQEFGSHPNIVRLLDVVRAQNDRDLYLVFESMETDLQAVLRKGGLLKDIHRRYILCQLLRATKFLHSGGVIHRDQKPSNVLLDADCFVKLCDFGLARSLGQIQADEGGPPLTEYVATRWYRAPEILLASRRYTEGVDMWSLGCILGEMLLGKPLFPGSSTLNQIEQILRVVAPSSPEDVGAFHSDYSASIISRMGGQQRVSFEELLPASTPPEALDLLKRLLVFNPEKRLTAEEALQHPYVQRFHCPAKEPALRSNVILPLDDNVQLSVAEYRNKLYEMILEKKAQRRQRQRQEETLPAAPPPEARAHCEPEPAQGPFPPQASPGPLGATVPCAAAPRRTSEASSPGPRPKISSAAAQGSLAPSHLARNRSAPLHPQPQQPQEAAASFSRRPRRQGSCPQTSATGTAAAAGGMLPPHSLMPWETNERSLPPPATVTICPCPPSGSSPSSDEEGALAQQGCRCRRGEPEELRAPQPRSAATASLSEAL
ncbi:mitogen-activated protein kinase 15-like isoform X3 [Sceloporus undulatus]|uniref:mitogen-activated protein kinase 15-like isoform X3 n=1 Tax=Sceloporus undulatus TaxID=8520 RepID=UPI001C4B8144|nr:mitogen-activated protein kinase 15-like isoform X3 [Sceloporus undulatus]